MSPFDPKLFLETSTSEALSTVRIPIPAQEHLVVVDKVDCRAWTKRDDPSKSGLALDVTYSIDSPAVKELLGRDKVTVTQGIMLDLTPTGALDSARGRNTELGRLREATGLNKPGESFKFGMLLGKVLKVKVVHSPNPERPDEPYQNVRDTVKA